LRAAIHAKPDYAEAYYTLEGSEAEGRAPGFRGGFAGSDPSAAGFCRRSYNFGNRAPPTRRRGGAAAESKAGAEIAKQKQASSRSLCHKLRAPAAKRGDLDGAISQFRAAINLRRTMRRHLNWVWRCASRESPGRRKKNFESHGTGSSVDASAFSKE